MSPVALNDRKIDYVEFTVDSIPAVRTFYEAAFGWKFRDFGPSYTDFSDGRLTGGLAAGTRAPGARGALVVLYAVDLGAVRNQILAAGGKLIGELLHFPGGCRFHFSDPAGNELAVWSEKPGSW